MTRQEIKAIAKQVLKAKYWPIVGATVLAPLIIGVVGSVLPVVGTVATFFVMPLMCGLIYVLLAYLEERDTSIGDMFNVAFDGKYYMRRVGGMAWMSLFIFLWSLLFVIPGIIKSLSYSLTPYILTRYPEVGAKEALKLSMSLMEGKKTELFVLTLSFIGWILLSSLTFGILIFFFVLPYMMLATALWSKNVLDEAERTGKLTASM